MIKEYALQPELLSSEPVCRYLYEKFGYGRGRIIARYPKAWVKTQNRHHMTITSVKSACNTVIATSMRR